MHRSVFLGSCYCSGVLFWMTHFAVMSLSQKSMTGWAHAAFWLPQTFDLFSLDQCLFVLLLSCLRVSPFPSFREAGDLNAGSSQDPAVVPHLYLQLHFPKVSFPCQRPHAVRTYLSLCHVLCFPETFTVHDILPVRAVGAGIGTSPLQTRKTEAQRLQVTLSRSHSFVNSKIQTWT